VDYWILLPSKNNKPVNTPPTFTKYNTINELYAAAGYPASNQPILFDIIDFAEIGNATKKMIPPHRRNFYTIIFFEHQQQGNIKLNTEYHQQLENVLLFHGSDHVFSFVRDENIKGFVILFEAAFLHAYYPALQNEFPFFSIYHQNIFHLSPAELKSFQHITHSLFLEKNVESVAKPLLAAFLQKSTILLRRYLEEEKVISPKNFLLRKFRQLISNHYTLSKNVEYYAQLLAITPAYLNEVVKSLTGNTAKQLIMERIVLEAENLLLHTNLDIAQIAHMLNFSEPTHFVKFFKKERNITPKAYRQQEP
jgi:AraC-like DNA-binding protein